MRVIVTGATGYIGRHVMRYLGKFSNLEVIGLSRRLSTEDKKSVGNCYYQELDISESVSKGNFGLNIKPEDCLIHLAYRNGFDHYNPSHFKDLSMHYELVQQSLLAGCTNINIMGSVHEIGYFEGEVTNNTLCNPVTPYGISKNALRQAVQSLAKQQEFSLKWFRGFYINGDDEFSKSIFGKILRLYKQGIREFDLTSGLNKFDFIDVNDLAEMICVSSLQTEITGIINTCSGKPVSLKSEVERFVQKNKLDVILNFGKYPQRDAESPCIYGENLIIKKIMKNI